eukprot:2508071-Amphidinium_carterae.1
MFSEQTITTIPKRKQQHLPTSARRAIKLQVPNQLILPTATSRAPEKQRLQDVVKASRSSVLS